MGIHPWGRLWAESTFGDKLTQDLSTHTFVEGPPASCPAAPVTSKTETDATTLTGSSTTFIAVPGVGIRPVTGGPAIDTGTLDTDLDDGSQLSSVRVSEHTFYGEGE